MLLYPILDYGSIYLMSHPANDIINEYIMENLTPQMRKTINSESMSGLLETGIIAQNDSLDYIDLDHCPNCERDLSEAVPELDFDSHQSVINCTCGATFTAKL